jgi:hypothetical protein
MAERARSVYRPDITYGPQPIKRGHWTDRLPAIEKDLAAMEALLTKAGNQSTAGDARTKAAIAASTGKPERPSLRCIHTPPQSFQSGQAVSLNISFDSGEPPSAVRLHYRHVNQAERWQSSDMERSEQGYAGSISAAYSASPYALEYYFELRRAPDQAWLYPGFNATLSNQPYFVIAVYNTAI